MMLSINNWVSHFGSQENVTLSKIMNLIKGNFARKYNKWHKKEGKLWQRGYYETILKSERDVVSKINYTHNNPVKKGLIADPKDYEFSSYNQYYGDLRKGVQIPITLFQVVRP